MIWFGQVGGLPEHGGYPHPIAELRMLQITIYPYRMMADPQNQIAPEIFLGLREIMVGIVAMDRWHWHLRCFFRSLREIQSNPRAGQVRLKHPTDQIVIGATLPFKDIWYDDEDKAKRLLTLLVATRFVSSIVHARESQFSLGSTSSRRRVLQPAMARDIQPAPLEIVKCCNKIWKQISVSLNPILIGTN
jgi:hypothetical protein